MVQGKAWEADTYDLIASAATWTEVIVVCVAIQQWELAIPSVAASVLGTHFATRGIKFSWHWPFISLKAKRKKPGKPMNI